MTRLTIGRDSSSELRLGQIQLMASCSVKPRRSCQGIQEGLAFRATDGTVVHIYCDLK